ncbi:hypothetical protein [Methylobacterium radiotolerans]|uniref:hypothetical protein n=1 Tax=Methylobacterium radiotolerans TaxID=31998 RepID=UPI0011158278|nr:hypothetical protein [Methylobacterium radiotolerans]
MTVRVIPEREFIKAVERASPDRKDAARETLVKFAREPALPRLDFRPLKGKPGFFLIDGRRGDRIVLRKDAEDLFAAVDYGPHDNVYRRWNRRK